MVGTLAVRLPDLDKTIWINCNDEGVTITSADYVWNEDDSGSWERYEDVVMFEVNFRDDDPQSMWPLLLFDVLDGRLDYAALRQRRPDDAVLSGGG